MMNSKDHLINAFLKNHQTKAISALSQLSVSDLRELSQNLNHENQLLMFQGLTPSLAAKVLEKRKTSEVANILEDLDFVDAEVILRSMGTASREKVLSKLPSSKSDTFKEFLTYTKNQIGSYVNPKVVVFDEHITVEDAFMRLKSITAIKQHLLYIVDAKHCLIGYVTLSELLSSKPHVSIRTLMKPNDLFIRADMDIKEVLDNWDDRFFELPITGTNNRFLGIVDRKTIKSKNNLAMGVDTSVKIAGNALAELYMIGLTSLLGGSDS